MDGNILGHAVWCGGGCEGGSLPAWLRSARSFVAAALPDLYEQAEPVDLPQRIILVQNEFRILGPIFEWPAADLDPAAIARMDSASIGFGEGILVDGASGDALRDLRRLLSTQTLPPTSAHIWHTRMEEDRPEYFLYLRDSIPWEDERGIVVVP